MPHSLNRRRFLKTAATLGAGALVSPLPVPGAVITPRVIPTPLRRPVAIPPATVAFVKTQDRAEGVRRLVELLGVNPVRGEHTFVKPNFNSAHPAPGSTHPDTLRALIEWLQAQGAERITVGDRSGQDDAQRVMDANGFTAMAEELGFDTLAFDRLPQDAWQWVQPEGSHWASGFPLPRPFLEADSVVATGCLKTHQYGGQMTLSLKLAVGLVAKTVGAVDGYHNYMNELHASPHMRRMIAEINTAYEPALVVLDGVEAFVDGGPHVGTRVQAQVMLAGTDRVAVDAVGVALLRYFGTTPAMRAGRIFENEQIARAVELGLGVSSPQQITLLTDDPASAEYAAQIQRLLLEQG